MDDDEYKEAQRLQEEGKAMEVEARKFIEGNLGALDAPDEQGQLLMLLNDGTILCNLINKIKPGCCKEPNTSANPYHQKKNVENYINAAAALGVPEHNSFEVMDLFEGKDMRGVLASIHALGIVAADTSGYAGPKMAFETSNRRRSTNSQNAAGMAAAKQAQAEEAKREADEKAAAKAEEKAKKEAAIAASRGESVPAAPAEEVSIA